MNADAIWALLSPEERAKFISAMQDPSSELMQNLLASEQLEKDKSLPWWQDDQNSDGQRGILPKILTIPSEMRKVYPHSHSLLYNLCAIWYSLDSFQLLIDVRLASLTRTQRVPLPSLRWAVLLQKTLIARKLVVLYPNLCPS